VGPLGAEAKAALARLYASAGASDEGGLIAGDASTVAGGIASQFAASGATALNLRVNVLGIRPEETRRQIQALAAALPAIRNRGLEVDVQDQ
jgi:hypothetical protein